MSEEADTDELEELFLELMEGGRVREAYRLAAERVDALREEDLSPELGDWLLNLAVAAVKRKKRVTARRCYEEALVVLEECEPEDRLVIALELLARFHEERGRPGDFRRARPLWKRARKIADRVLDEADDRRLSVLLGQAWNEVCCGKIERALEMLVECEAALVPGTRARTRERVANRFIELARLLAGMADDVAEDLLVRALAVMEASEEELDVVVAADALGNHYLRHGRWKDAVAAYRRGLRWAERKKKTRALGRLTCLANLGPALGELGEQDEAEACLEKALEVAPTVAHNPSLDAFIRNALGEVKLARGLFAASAREHRAAIAIAEELPRGADARTLRRGLYGLGCALGALGDAKEARAALKRARVLYGTGERPDESMVAACDEKLRGLR